MAKFIRWQWFQAVFGGFRWYRRLHGGRWEFWIIDHPGILEQWFYVPPEFVGQRPMSLCRGNPIVEQYKEPPNV